MPDSVVDAIQGHTLKSAGAATYRHISPRMMADAINQIPVPGEIANQPTERRKAACRPACAAWQAGALIHNMK
jgi:hypothetical protein